ncbi:hypothetical protein QBC43DRAFT_298842 [Cladorrhinum sp. PSN259]|nr:hypothetical protein QBC43DRAFT_298842 [Cladorrhinum sp. PSN259]
MNTTPERLKEIGRQESLEAWWHPLWTYKLLFFVRPGYTGTSQNLSIAPQPALRNPITGAAPYCYPDFAVISSGQNAQGAVGRRLRLVMEIKRYVT